MQPPPSSSSVSRATLLAFAAALMAVAPGRFARAQAGNKDFDPPLVVQGQGIVVSLEEVQAMVDRQPPAMRAGYRDLAKLSQAVDEIVDFELLAAEAERRGFASDPAVERALQQDLVERLLAQAIDRHHKPEGIPNKRIEAYYNEHRSRYARPKLVRARHILVDSVAKARDLLQDLKNRDEYAFAEAARRLSLDRETNQRGGDLRYFSITGSAAPAQGPSVDTRLARAAFRVSSPGTLYPKPIALDDKWSVLRVDAIRPEKRKPLADVAEAIRMELWRSDRRKRVSQLESSLKKKHRVEVNYGAIEKIQLFDSKKQP